MRTGNFPINEVIIKAVRLEWHSILFLERVPSNTPQSTERPPNMEPDMSAVFAATGLEM